MTISGRVLWIFLASALALGSAGCCLGRGRPTGTETTTISGPGFSPDPTTTSALAGGTMEASSLAQLDAQGNYCAGRIPPSPQHLLRVGAAMPMLRILVNGSEDTTLVVRGPDGAFHCNDDSGDPNHGTNPVVEIAGAPAGDYAIYVGAFSSQAMLSTYSIGFTATPNTYPSEVVR